MPRPRLSMRPLRQILRLKYQMGLSHRAIARACSVGVGTVGDYVRRARDGGLSWPLPAELDDAALEAKLFPPPAPSGVVRPAPDLAWIHQELRRTGVTLQLLWHEYLEVHPEGYRYTQFCERYRQWRGKLKPSMRQVHRAGEKVFVDYSGKRPHIVDRHSGEMVAVWSCSSAYSVRAPTRTRKPPEPRNHRTGSPAMCAPWSTSVGPPSSSVPTS